MAIGLLSFLFGIVFILVAAIVYLSCCDPFSKSPRLSARSSGRSQDPRSSKRNTEMPTKQPSTKPSEKPEGVKKRNVSSRRRED